MQGCTSTNFEISYTIFQAFSTWKGIFAKFNVNLRKIGWKIQKLAKRFLPPPHYIHVNTTCTLGSCTVFRSTNKVLQQVDHSDAESLNGQSCVMWSRQMDWNSQILILRYSQTKQISSLFPVVVVVVFNPSTAHLWNHLTNFNGVSSFANDRVYKSEKWRLNLTDFRLILLDCITYVYCWSVMCYTCLVMISYL